VPFSLYLFVFRHSKFAADMIKVGIIGGTGYTGVELLRLLAQHPQVELRVITSRAARGRREAYRPRGRFPPQGPAGHFDRCA
jgi:predicted dehydrogenase